MVEHGHLTEKIPFFKDRQHDFSARAQARDLDGTRLDDVHLIAAIALAADDVAFFVYFSENSEVVSHAMSPVDPKQYGLSISAEIKPALGSQSKGREGDPRNNGIPENTFLAYRVMSHNSLPRCCGPKTRALTESYLHIEDDRLIPKISKHP